MDLQNLEDPEWTAKQIERFYGYTPAVLEDFGFDPGGTLDRYEVEERLLTDSGWLSPKLTASELGITVESVEAVSTFFEASTSYASPFPQRLIGDSFVVSKSQLKDWIRELTGYRNLWRSIPDRTAKIIETFRQIFDEEGDDYDVQLLEDVVHSRYGTALREIEQRDEDVLPAASVWCAVTDDPVAIPHSEHLALSGGHKPVSLRPDRVGWHALLERGSELTRHVVGSLSRFRDFENACERADLI